MPNRETKRHLTIKIEGGFRQGKTTALWVIAKALENLGANVTIGGEDGVGRHKHIIMANDAPFHPGDLNALTVNFETTTIEEDD